MEQAKECCDRPRIHCLNEKSGLDTIEAHTTLEGVFLKKVLLTVEELTEYVLQEYPFLAEFFETKTNA